MWIRRMLKTQGKLINKTNTVQNMRYSFSNKGVTPVVAIVLLLLVTVGAVGIVYTQFQGIVDNVDNSNTDTEFLESVDVKINTPQRNTSNSNSNFDQIQIGLENTGEEQYNLSDIARLEYSIPGESRIRVTEDKLFGQFNHSTKNQTCFNNSESFSPGATASCNTGVQFPNSTDEITISLVQKAKETDAVIDEVTCSPNTDDSTTC
jgi:archaellum component FlaF (FlaF/FlaG flagellin family)